MRCQTVTGVPAGPHLADASCAIPKARSNATFRRRRGSLGRPLANTENHLIELLPRKDRASLLAICAPVQLALREVLYEPGTATRHVYFPQDGFISLVARLGGYPGVEVGMVGREGMLGAHVVLGVPTAPLHAVVQGPGAAWRIGVAEFRRELAHNASLRRGLKRYIHVLMTQLAASAGCLRFHLIGPRLARWLLMSQDRAHADDFRVTHEFLAYMLGVRRVGVTTAAVALQRSGLIDYHRGAVTVLDRPGLEAAACSCYASDCEAYAGVIG